MKKAIVGKKIGMTQIFTDDGRLVPVTVVEAGPCPVVQKKTVETDGYEAVQVGFDEYAENRAKKLVNKPDAGHFKKANVAPTRHLRELKLDNAAELEVGNAITVSQFEAGEKIDVCGLTKGHGFTGAIFRWGQHTGPMAHGSKYHRGVGSMSANSDPSRVFKKQAHAWSPGRGARHHPEPRNRQGGCGTQPAPHQGRAARPQRRLAVGSQRHQGRVSASRMTESTLYEGGYSNHA